jgi:uncharacterized protein YgfB (UPF0149 family)
MLVYLDVLSGSDIASDSYETTEVCDGAVLAMESKKITVGDVEVDIGANASKEGEDAEELESSAETVINIVKSHSLMKVSLDKKEYKAAMKSYWKSLVKKRQANIYTFLGIEDVPKEKDELKKAVAEAESKLGKFDKPVYKTMQEEMKVFKGRFDAVQEWVNKEVVGNFDEFEFYLPDGGELGECIIIPARYIGEAIAPTFYFYKVRFGLVRSPFNSSSPPFHFHTVCE